MIKKILIANRGEIACRIIRTAHKLSIPCVAVYSKADENALHVKEADEAYCIGDSPAQESYLCGDKILEIAKKSNADAIHPGYGFLSENAEFVEACKKFNIIFIGPPVEAIRAMGSKSEAKKIMEQANVPLVPGYHDDAQDFPILQKAAKKIGYPVLLKAAAGGGGKGMRVVWKESELEQSIASAKREALASFGNDQLLIEKYLTQPRHIEIQVFADNHGNFIYLFERDCSIQRRHQKIIEEAPAPKLTKNIREQIGNAAIDAAKAIHYVGAGTVEFLFDDGNFYFMEMNTRLQVEHPVTEMITGQDLVEWQIRVAEDKPLPLKQKDLKINGHAFEARIYAEDPDNDFLPSTGLIQYLKTPAENEHVRIDTGFKEGDTITHYYDPMISKLIVWDIDRKKALAGLHKALGEYQIVGITTNLNLLANITEEKDFIDEDFDTGFIAKHQSTLFEAANTPETIIVMAALSVLNKQKTKAKNNSHLSLPWHINDNWRLNLIQEQRLRFYVNNEEVVVNAIQQKNSYLIEIQNKKFFTQLLDHELDTLKSEINSQEYQANIFWDKEKCYILCSGSRYHLTLIDDDAIDHQYAKDEIQSHLTAPMPSKVVAILVKEGDKVERGAGLVVVEAMKMEHTIHAPSNGIVKEWHFKVGDIVGEGVALLAFEEE
jgi:3-methylcrotonyl-CoA carboxylase alpha subunit